MKDIFRKGLQWYDWVALIFLTLGGIHLGILGIFNINLIYVWFGMEGLARVIFGLIGVSVIFSTIAFWKMNK